MLKTGRRGQLEPEGGNCGPREASSTKLKGGFVGNQDILGFWTVDIPLGGSQPEISSAEETHSTPEKVRQLYSQKTKQQARGRR